MSKYQKYYRRGQEKARNEAIEYQFRLFDEENPISWGEIAEWTEYFRKLGKRFGLMQEFAENLIV